MCVYELCHSNVCVCALGVSGFEQLLPFLLKLWGEMMKLGCGGKPVKYRSLLLKL